jgi:hypothetical protein
MTIRALLSRLDGVRPCSGGYVARCPAHPDFNPSLSIAEADDGKILLYCHAGCDFTRVIGALGLRARDLFPPRGFRR